MKKPSLAVVGAGMSGLACARRLAGTDVDIRLFDKGRSPGGRLATRRVETHLGPVRFDHGAQYVTARSPAFARLMENAILAGAAAPWAFDDGAAVPDASSRSPLRRWIGTPGMSAFARHMAEGLAIETSVRITRICRDAGGWRLEVERADQRHAESEGPFDAVVVALPAEQTAPLLGSIAPGLAGEAAAARTAPCWAGLFAFDRRIHAPFDVRRFGAGEALTWVARETSKPGRSGPEAWVVHAGPAWTRALRLDWLRMRRPPVCAYRLQNTVAPDTSTV